MACSKFPADPVCVGIKDQYMLGSRCLVAPVMEAGARSRKLYLPADSSWRNVDTGETFEGGQWIDAPAPLDVIPVFERI